MVQAIGPVILDLLGPELLAEEREILQHPSVGGVILFSRNYESPKQVTALCKAIRQARSLPLLIAVDQEGGPVQRFREGFTRIPPMAQLGCLYDEDSTLAIALAEKWGWLMASEVLAVGVDLSFAPVLDLNKGLNPITNGGRSFHRDPKVVFTLARTFLQGMQRAGMAATGKHFPGHGAVTLDTHYAVSIDDRALDDIMADDMIPFAELIHTDLDAVMPAHIIYSAVDDKPAVFSARWLKDILRRQLHFSGMIFSDDLNMKGAEAAGDFVGRAQLALTAGCDMILICNNRPAAIQILDHLPDTFPVEIEKFKRLQGKHFPTLSDLQSSAEWRACQEFLLQNRRDYEYAK